MLWQDSLLKTERDKDVLALENYFENYNET